MTSHTVRRGSSLSTWFNCGAALFNCKGLSSRQWRRSRVLVLEQWRRSTAAQCMLLKPMKLLSRTSPHFSNRFLSGSPVLQEKIKVSQVEGMKVDRSIEFSYEELSDATNNFGMDHKSGQGGFGSVYYADLRGEKAVIKKMDTKASQEFLNELKVLTCVHHLNLVRLIGYCVESCLFLVYEFIENGNLTQHLHGTGYQPLSWTKLSEIGTTSQSLQSLRVVGTFGYIPPECARYGEVSPKVDVYAFGIVLYELLSAKEAIVRSSEFTEAQGLVYPETLSMPNPKEALQELIDPRLGRGYPIDSVVKIAYLAKSCTHEDSRMRPTMRSIVVALMALSSKDHEFTRGQD